MDKTAYILETAIYAGKPNVCNLIKGLDTSHDHFTDLIGADFTLQRILNRLLDLGGDPVQVSNVHLPLIKGANHGVKYFISIKTLAGPITLDNDDRQTFHDLVGGKAPLAVQSLTATANAQPILTVPGIYDLAFLIAAKRTFHGKSAPFSHLILSL